MRNQQALREEVVNSFELDNSDIQEGYLTDVKVIDSYAPYYQESNSRKPLHDSAHPTIEDVHEYIQDLTGIKGKSLKYDPEIAILVELEGESQQYYIKPLRHNLNPWSPSDSLVHMVQQQIGVAELSEDNKIPVLYAQDNIFAPTDEGIVKKRQNLHEGEPDEYKLHTKEDPTPFKDDCSQLDSYLEYVREKHTNPTEWVETTIKSVLLPDTDKLPILVNTPLGNAKFIFSKRDPDIMGYEKLMRDLNAEKPSDLSGKTVYIRPDYHRLHEGVIRHPNDEGEYTESPDTQGLWEISLDNPNEEEENHKQQLPNSSLIDLEKFTSKITDTYNYTKDLLS